MTKSPLTAAPPIAVVPDVAKSNVDVSASASETELSHSDAKTRERSGVTFDTAGLGPQLYKPIEKYEGKHRYDPDFEWEPEEERKVVRKVRRTTLRSEPVMLTYSRLIRKSAPGSA